MENNDKNTSFSGPRYVTKKVRRLENGMQKVITSRRHRKGRGSLVITAEGLAHSALTKPKYPWLHFWSPRRLTWWVAVLFAIGSACFSVGGYAITFPDNIPKALADGTTVDMIFFVGSIFFTSAAFCQLLETINAGDSEGLFDNETPANSFQWLSWQPKRIGYMASLVQLIGTIMFNFNTGNALISDLTWGQHNILIWIPNIIGCVCFLIASRLAFMEVCHGFWGWHPGSIEWWITTLNFIGSIGFMISAFYSLSVPPGENVLAFTWLSAVFLFQGGVCFFIASYLLLPEMFSE